MALANVSYTANGSTTTFVVSFGYLQASHITVTLDAVVTAAYTFDGSGNVVMDVAPTNGVILKIQRDSDITQKLVAFADGSNLTEEDLNNDASQGIFLQQETRDNIDDINSVNAGVDARITVNETDIDALELEQLEKVNGAATATDNSVMRHDGTTGKISQDSGIIIDDSDAITGITSLNTHTLPAGTGTIALTTDTAPSAVKVLFEARIDEAGGLVKGDVVYINGATGNQMEASKAINNDYTKIEAIAVATESGADNATIHFQNFGEVTGLDTSSYTEGDILYLDSTSGLLTATHPSGIEGVMRVARVVSVHASNGIIFVHIVHQTIANNHDGIVRVSVANANTGTSSSANFSMINDASHRSSISMTGANYSQVADIAESLVIYNEGYNKTVNAVDGNFGFEWWTDETDSHNLSATAKMALSAAGMLTVNGGIDINHTAIESDDHALEIIANAAGFGDVKAIDIDYITGTLAASADEGIITINIDESASTGGDVSALEVLTTTEGLTDVNGMLVGVGINPIRHLSGAFTDMDSALVNATDRLAEFISDASDIEMFTADNDTITIGNTAKFEEIEFILSTVASKNIQPTYEYSTGVGTWASFTPVDGTNGMLNTGVIAWLSGDIASWVVGAGSEYLVKITRTRNGSITSPIESLVQVAVTTEYCWTKDGDIKARGFTLGTSTEVTSVLDEDTLSSDSATALATQQSIKAYADSLIDGGTASDTNRITIPSDAKSSLDALTRKEATVVYASDENKLYADDGTDLIEIGSGGGSGGINYITGSNTNAEVDIGDWVTYLDTAGVNPVNGVDGTSVVTFAVNATTPMRGAQDFKMVKDAANRQGSGSSVPFTIDLADKAQMLTISFDYDASHAGYADDDIRLSVYDVTNSKLIRVNGEDLKGGKGSHIAQFQTSSDSVSYRLIMHVSSVSAVAYDLYFDNIQVGPREVAKGGLLATQSIRYDTNAGYGSTNTRIPYFTTVRQNVGGSLVTIGNDSVNGFSITATQECNISVTYSSRQGGSVNSEIGISLNSTELTTGIGSIGVASRLAYSGDNSSITGMSVTYNGTIASGDVLRPHTSAVASASNPQNHITILVTSMQDVIMSEDIGNREIVVEGAGNDGTSVTSGVTDINFTETKDTTSSWNGSQFIAPETGNYLVSGTVFATTATDTGIGIHVDTVLIKRISDQVTEITHNFTGTIYLEKGQVMSLRSGGASFTLSNAATIHHISIQKLASPQTILETATVAARYTSNSGQTLVRATNDVVVFEDIDYDTHNAMNTSTGVYTVPVSGKYSVKSSVKWQGIAMATSVSLAFNILISGVDSAQIFHRSGSATVTQAQLMNGSTDFDLVKGDTIEIAAYQDSATNENLTTGSTNNFVAIARIK